MQEIIQRIRQFLTGRYDSPHFSHYAKPNWFQWINREIGRVFYMMGVGWLSILLGLCVVTIAAPCWFIRQIYRSIATALSDIRKLWRISRKAFKAGLKGNRKPTIQELWSNDTFGS